MMTDFEWKLKMAAMRRTQYEAQGYVVDVAGTCHRSPQKQELKMDRAWRKWARRKSIGR